ncbi:MAG TPA: PorT family protein [Candidatus Aminicenantes bacterium]|nr:PorT family protein [Candidatus Aminicenantes bacterium]
MRDPGLKIKMLAFLLIFFSGSLVLWSHFRMISPGLKVGGGVSNIFGSDTFDQRWQGSATAGVFLDVFLARRFHLQPEILWVQKGSLYEVGQGQPLYRERLVLDYLEIPVLFKAHFLDYHRFRFYTFAGPAAAINLRAQLKVTFDGLEESVGVENLRGTDLLLCAGMGAEFKIKSGSLLIELRLEEGLKSISTEIQSEIKNRAIVCLAGYKF